jgi:hypothetical protein
MFAFTVAPVGSLKGFQVQCEESEIEAIPLQVLQRETCVLGAEKACLREGVDARERMWSMYATGSVMDFEAGVERWRWRGYAFREVECGS